MHTRPEIQRVSSGAEDAEGMVGETRKEPHKTLPSKLRPAAKRRIREQKLWQGFQG